MSGPAFTYEVGGFYARLRLYPARKRGSRPAQIVHLLRLEHFNAAGEICAPGELFYGVLYDGATGKPIPGWDSVGNVTAGFRLCTRQWLESERFTERATPGEIEQLKMVRPTLPEPFHYVRPVWETGGFRTEAEFQVALEKLNAIDPMTPRGYPWRYTQAQKDHTDDFGQPVKGRETYFTRERGLVDRDKLSARSMAVLLGHVVRDTLLDVLTDPEDPVAQAVYQRLYQRFRQKRSAIASGRTWDPANTPEEQ